MFPAIVFFSLNRKRRVNAFYYPWISCDHRYTLDGQHDYDGEIGSASRPLSRPPARKD